MRNFDIWNRYTDNHGNPLHGCVMFNVFGGNTPAPIYDSEGTAIDNPQLTDYYGRTGTQVFVDSDVTAYFYKYIGTGIWNTELDIDVNDDTKWSLQYTADSREEIDIDIVSDSAVCVPSVTGLRNLDADGVPDISGTKVVTLLGYNAPGDKEPVNYVWNPESTLNDNNGSVIKGPDTTGRWIMVKPTEHCDCRHFGIFPAVTLNGAPDNSLNFTNLVEYCNSVGIRPFISAEPETRYYALGSNVTCPVIDMGGEPYIRAQGRVWHAEINGDCTLSGITLYSNYAKASWGMAHWYKEDSDRPATFIYDTSFNASFTDTDVYVKDGFDKPNNSYGNCRVYYSTVDNPLRGNFSGCEFFKLDNSATLSSGCSFTRCELKGDYWDSVYSVQSVTDCTYDPEDFKYNQAMFQVISAVAGDTAIDYGNMVVAENMALNTAVDSDYSISNVICNGVNKLTESGNRHDYYFKNVRGSLEIKANAANNFYRFVDCDVQLSVVNGTREITLQFENSSVNVSGSLPNASIISIGGSLGLTGSQYRTVSVQNGNLSGTSVTVDNFSSYNSIVNVTVSSANTVLKDSQLNAPLTIRDREVEGIYRTATDIYGNVTSGTYTHVIDGFVDNNVLNAPVILSPSGTNTLVYGLTVTHNSANIVNPLVIPYSSNWFAPVDDLHYYVIKDNAGRFKDTDTCTVGKTLTVVEIPSETTAMPDDCAVTFHGQVQDFGTLCLYTDNYYDDVSGHENGISGPFDYYRFGYDDFLVDVEYRVTTVNIQDVCPDSILIPQKFTMRARRNSNGTYSLIMRRPGNHQDSNRTSLTHIGLLMRSTTTSWAGTVLTTTMTARKWP